MRFDGSLTGWKAVGTAVFIVLIVAARVITKMNRWQGEDPPAVNLPPAANSAPGSLPIVNAPTKLNSRSHTLPAERIALDFIHSIRNGQYVKDIPEIAADAQLPPEDRVRAFRMLERFIKSQEWDLWFTGIEVLDGKLDAVDCYLRGGDGGLLVLLVEYHYDVKQWRVGAYEIPEVTFARPENESYPEYVARSVSEFKTGAQPFKDGVLGDGRYFIDYSQPYPAPGQAPNAAPLAAEAPVAKGPEFTVEGVLRLPTPAGFEWKTDDSAHSGVTHTLVCSKPGSLSGIVLTVEPRAASDDSSRLAALQAEFNALVTSAREAGLTDFRGEPPSGESPIPDRVQFGASANLPNGSTTEFRVATVFGKRNIFHVRALSTVADEAEKLIRVAEAITELEPTTPPGPAAADVAAERAATGAPPPSASNAAAQAAAKHPPLNPTETPPAAEVIQLAAPIFDAVVGGEGRFMVLHLAGVDNAAVVDLASRQVAFTVPAPQDALLAAGKDRLVVISPSDRQVRRWSLLDSQELSGGQLDIAGQAQAVALGSASAGPLLVQWSDESRGRYSLLDLETLETRQISASNSGLEPGQVNFSNTNKTGVELRASADGRVFVSREVGSQKMERLFVGPPLVVHSDGEGGGHATPSSDGRIICRGSGLFSGHLAWRGGKDNRPCFATCDPRYFLTLSEEGLFVRDAATGTTLHSLPPLPELGKDFVSNCRFGMRREQYQLLPDQRIHCAPSQNLLVTIPESGDRLFVRTIPFNTLSVNSPPFREHLGGEIAAYHMPGLISGAVSAAGGRLLILHLAERGEAAIFDIAQEKLVGAIPASAGALIAAGSEKLVIVDPQEKQVSRWSLTTLQEEAKAPLKLAGDGLPRIVEIGAASAGPALIYWTHQPGGAFSLLDVDRLALSPLSKSLVDGKVQGKVAIQTTGQSWGGVAARASLDGQAFGIWKTGGSPTGVEIVSLGKTPTAKYDHASHGHVIPAAGGRVLTGSGAYNAHLEFQKNDGLACFPTSDARYAVCLTDQGGEIRELATDKPIAKLPALDELGKDFVRYCGFGKDYGQLRLRHDQRVFCLLAEGLLITIPETDDGLILRKLTFDEPPPLSQPAAQAKTSPAAKGGELDREWSDKTGAYKITARLLRADANTVTLEKSDGAQVTVPLEKLSDADVEYLKEAKSIGR